MGEVRKLQCENSKQQRTHETNNNDNDNAPSYWKSEWSGRVLSNNNDPPINHRHRSMEVTTDDWIYKRDITGVYWTRQEKPQGSSGFFVHIHKFIEKKN